MLGLTKKQETIANISDIENIISLLKKSKPLSIHASNEAKDTIKKGKVTKSLKRITNIEICFQVLRNITAERGYKTVYIRIADANGEVLKHYGIKAFSCIQELRKLLFFYYVCR